MTRACEPSPWPGLYCCALDLLEPYAFHSDSNFLYVWPSGECLQPVEAGPVFSCGAGGGEEVAVVDMVDMVGCV